MPIAALEFGTLYGADALAGSTPQWSKAIYTACALTGAVACLAAYAIIIRRMEHRPVAELSLRKAPLSLLTGAILGCAMFTAVVAILAALGIATFSPASTFKFPIVTLAIALLAASAEEAVFRGGLLRLIEERFGTLIGVTVSAIAFGLTHFLNDGATWLGVGGLVLEFGIPMALAYTATRSLWLPIGIHAFWNFTEGGVFSTEISGGGKPLGLLHTTLRGPDYLTGGSFGPEGSVVAVVVCLTVAAIFLMMTVRRGARQPARI